MIGKKSIGDKTPIKKPRTCSFVIFFIFSNFSFVVKFGKQLNQNVLAPHSRIHFSALANLCLDADLHLQIHELYNAGVIPEDIAYELDITTDWVHDALSVVMFVDMLEEEYND